MNRDVFLSILAMDSYNRGYGQGVNLPTGSTQIGNATITQDSSVLVANGIRQDIPAGFFAIAYRVSGVAGIEDGTQVISYRGTNFGETGFAPAPACAGAMVRRGETASISSGAG